METNFDAVIKSKRPVLVDFHKASSARSKALDPVLRDVKDCLQHRISVIKVDADRNAALADRYKILDYPTLVLFRNGRQLWRQSGLMKKDEILVKIIEKHQ